MDDRGERPEEGVADYRAVSGLAIGGLLASVASVVAFVNPVFWAAPVGAAALNTWALVHIARRSPSLIGRKAAMAGLALAVMFGVAAPTRYFVDRWKARQSANELAQQWFDALRTGHPEAALALRADPAARKAGNDAWRAGLDEAGAQKLLGDFLGNHAVKAVLAAGNQAQIEYLGTDSQQQSDKRRQLALRYSVTSGEGATRKVTIVVLGLQQPLATRDDPQSWRVMDAQVVESESPQ